jgi:hypothetical protein
VFFGFSAIKLLSRSLFGNYTDVTGRPMSMTRTLTEWSLLELRALFIIGSSSCHLLWGDKNIVTLKPQIMRLFIFSVPRMAIN